MTLADRLYLKSVEIVDTLADVRREDWLAGLGMVGVGLVILFAGLVL